MSGGGAGGEAPSVASSLPAFYSTLLVSPEKGRDVGDTPEDASRTRSRDPDPLAIATTRLVFTPATSSAFNPVGILRPSLPSRSIDRMNRVRAHHERRPQYSVAHRRPRLLSSLSPRLDLVASSLLEIRIKTSACFFPRSILDCPPPVHRSAWPAPRGNHDDRPPGHNQHPDRSLCGTLVSFSPSEVSLTFRDPFLQRWSPRDFARSKLPRSEAETRLPRLSSRVCCASVNAFPL